MILGTVDPVLPDGKVIKKLQKSQRRKRECQSSILDN